MRINSSQLITSTLLTLCVLIFFEILSTSLLPLLGFEKFRISVNVLIILFLCFKVHTPYLAVIILIIQIFHGAFSVEGWAVGTFAGICISLIISYVRDLLHFNSGLMTIILTQIFQLLWFGIISFVYFLKVEDNTGMGLRFWHFVPESIFLSLCSPLFFKWFEKIWKTNQGAFSYEE